MGPVRLEALSRQRKLLSNARVATVGTGRRGPKDPASASATALPRVGFVEAATHRLRPAAIVAASWSHPCHARPQEVGTTAGGQAAKATEAS